MVNGAAMLEHMMQQAAAELGIQPIDLRLNNLMFQGSFIRLYSISYVYALCIFYQKIFSLIVNFSNLVNLASSKREGFI